MRSKLALSAVVLLCLAAMAPAADAAGEMLFGLNGGMVIPSGEFRDGFKSGFGGGIFGDYMVNEQLAIGLDAGFNANKVKDDVKKAFEALIVDELHAAGATTASATYDARITGIPIGLHAKWLPVIKDSPIAPYVQAGVGMYNLKFKESLSATADGASASVTLKDSQHKFGFSGGAGVNFKATPAFQIGLGGAVHTITTQGSSTTYATLGVNLIMRTGAK